MRTTYDNTQNNNQNNGQDDERRHPRHHGFGRGKGRTDFAGDGGGEGRQYRRGGFGPGGRGPGGFGPGGFGPGDFGPEGPGGPGAGGPWRGGGPRGRGGRGFRARKGDIRLAILSVLAETPSNGYGLMQAIAEKSSGAWRPSPGSVYPTLAQLVDEGLISTTGDTENDRRSAFALTESGTAYVAEQAEAIATAWSGATEEVDAEDPFATAARKLFGVVRQIATDGTAEQREQAGRQMDEMRRSLYRMLGE